MLNSYFRGITFIFEHKLDISSRMRFTIKEHSKKDKKFFAIFEVLIQCS